MKSVQQRYKPASRNEKHANSVPKFCSILVDKSSGLLTRNRNRRYRLSHSRGRLSSGPYPPLTSCIFQRACLVFIPSLVERCFRVDLLSQVAVNSGLFTRIERVKMPKRDSNKRESYDEARAKTTTTCRLVERSNFTEKLT